MISLLSGFWKTCTSKPVYKVLIVGTENSGKTTLLNQMKALHGQKHHSFEKITPTVGLNLGKIEKVGFSLLLWDLGGRDILRPIWNKYYPECHGIVFMIDGANEDKVADALQTLNELMKNPDIEGVPILVMVNKKEKTNYFGREYIERHEHYKLNFVKERDLNLVEVSVLNKTNLEESLEWLYEAIGDFHIKAPSLDRS